MNEQTAGEKAAVIPRDAKEALELWEKGEEIAAFEVETQRCTQAEIYSLAFEMMRAGKVQQVGTTGGVTITIPTVEAVRNSMVAGKISKREIDTAHSIAYVALLKGWAPMVAQHLASGHIKAITVKKS
jgi:hypothetical protein